MNVFVGYVGVFIFSSVQGYILIKSQRLLLIENYNEEENFKRIKYILDLERDGFIMFNNKKLIYYNKAVSSILEKFDLTADCSIKNVMFALLVVD
jgi:hypothetical protein